MNPIRQKLIIFTILFLYGLSPFYGEVAFSFQISLVPYASGLSQPVAITHAGDGSGRLFVIEQGGVIKIFKNGVLQATPFLNISNRVFFGGERGLLGLAFSPGYSTKGYFYVNYTRTPDGATTISRFRVTGNPDVADPNSEELILTVAQPFANHNGGQIAFSPSIPPIRSAPSGRMNQAKFISPIIRPEEFLK